MCGEANRMLNLKTYVPYVPTRDGRHTGRTSLIWFIQHQPSGEAGGRRRGETPARLIKGATRTLH